MSVLDRVPALWNTSADNPAVQARQAHAERYTQFQIDNDPEYRRQLAQLRSWLTDFEAPREAA